MMTPIDPSDRVTYLNVCVAVEPKVSVTDSPGSRVAVPMTMAESVAPGTGATVTPARVSAVEGAGSAAATMDADGCSARYRDMGTVLEPPCTMLVWPAESVAILMTDVPCVMAEPTSRVCEPIAMAFSDGAGLAAVSIWVTENEGFAARNDATGIVVEAFTTSTKPLVLVARLMTSDPIVMAGMLTPRVCEPATRTLTGTEPVPELTVGIATAGVVTSLASVCCDRNDAIGIVLDPAITLVSPAASVWSDTTVAEPAGPIVIGAAGARV